MWKSWGDEVYSLFLVSVVLCGTVTAFVTPGLAANEDPLSRIEDVHVPDEVIIGESFEVTVDAENRGGEAGHWSTVSVSSPSLDESDDSSRIDITDASDHEYSGEITRGDDIRDKDGNTITADYALAEAGTGADSYWPGNQDRSFSVEFTPEETGTFVIYVRVTLTDDDDVTEKENHPASSSYRDQQDYYVERYEVEVREEPNIEADITWFDQETGTYEIGETVEATTTVKNTGNREHRFYVGYSVQGPGGEWYDEDGTTHESVNLLPGEEEEVNVDWTVESDAPPGEYDVRTRVYEDESGGELTGLHDTVDETNQFEVVNSPPTAQIECDATEYRVDESVHCSASESADADGEITTYRWYVDGELVDRTVNLDQSFSTSGTYTVTLEVVDNDGASAKAHETLTIVEPEPPRAVLDCDSETLVTGESLSCTAEGSTDPENAIEQYDWEFGDEATASGASASYAFAQPGTYAVVVRVTDDTGLVDTAETTVRVTAPNEEPTVSFSYRPRDPEPHTSVTFDAGESIDADGDIVEYRWEFPDGVTKHGVRVTHTFDDAGEHPVELSVTDGDGTEQTARQTVTVLSRPDVDFSFGPKKPKVGHDVTFEATTDVDIARFRWDLDNDGTYEKEGDKISHSFGTNGKKSVELKIVDQNGVQNRVSHVVHVQRNAYFDLTTNQRIAEPGDEAVVTFEISNNVEDKSLNAKLELNIPNGAQITSVSGDRIASSTSTQFVTVPPGEQSSLRVRVQMNDQGVHKMSGDAVYYFGDQNDRREQRVGPISIRAQSDLETPGPTPEPTPEPTPTSTPGFSASTAIAALAIILLLTAARRIRRP